jgi:protease I
VLQGRTSSAYPALSLDVEFGGGTYENGAAVVDGNLVSGRAWPDHPSWMREFMRILEAAHPATDSGSAAGGSEADAQPVSVPA